MMLAMNGPAFDSAEIATRNGPGEPGVTGFEEPVRRVCPGPGSGASRTGVAGA